MLADASYCRGAAHPLGKVLGAHDGVRVELWGGGELLVAVPAGDLHPHFGLLLGHHHLLHLLRLGLLPFVVLPPPLHLLHLSFNFHSRGSHMDLLFIIWFNIKENCFHWLWFHLNRLLPRVGQTFVTLSFTPTSYVFVSYRKR